MNLPVKLHEAAELEAAEAIAWYQTEAELGTALRVEIEKAIERVRTIPLAFPIVHGSSVRCALTHRFPFALIFMIEDGQIFIIAIFHTSRDPFIWKGRVG